MKTQLLVGFLLAGSAMFADPRIAIGMGIGVPLAPAYAYPVAPPPAYYAPAPVYATPVPAYIPPAPGIGFQWVAGYWYFSGAHRLWRPGYWAAPHARFYAYPGWRR